MDAEAIATLPDGKTLTVESGLRLLRRGSALIWQAKYRAAGKGRTKVLGTYPALSLESARAAAGAARGAAQPPSVSKVSPKVTAPAGGAPTFATVAAEWLRLPLADGDPPAPETIEARERMVANMGPLHNRPIDAITKAECLALVRAIQAPDERGKTRRFTAKRTLAALKDIFDLYSVTADNFLNPCAVTKKWLIAPKKGKYPAIVEAAAFLQLAEHVEIWAHERLEAHTRSDKRAQVPSVINALRLSMHVVVRQGELRKARWGQFHDLDNPEARWIIPPEQMKGGKRKTEHPHIVPLTSQALAILAEQRQRQGGAPAADALVFPGAPNAKKGRPMQNQALSDALNKLGYEGRHCPHGFRTSFSTIAHDAVHIDGPLAGEQRWSTRLINKCLAHKDPDVVSGAYNRGTQLAARRFIMQWWSEFVSGV